MQDVTMKVKDESGAVRSVLTIASNEDHVGNLIAEGQLQESDRWREIARLYKGQLDASARKVKRLMDVIAGIPA